MVNSINKRQRGAKTQLRIKLRNQEIAKKSYVDVPPVLGTSIDYAGIRVI
jgi:hypothetical protein